MATRLAKYDIGGDTVPEVIKNYSEVYGALMQPPIHQVPYGQAKAECDKISLDRYGTPYPEGNDGTLIGGMPDPQLGFQQSDHRHPASMTRKTRDLAVRLLRHEIGHQLGWAPEHPR